MELIEGIVVNTNKYQESSKIIYVLTKNEFKSLLVKSSLNYNSKNFAYSQELTKIGFLCTESNKNTFDIMKSGMVYETYKNIKDNYEKLLIVSKILNLVYRYHEHITDFSNLYNLLDYALNGINNSNIANYKYYDIIFKSKFLYLLGSGPNFNGCTVCDKKDAHLSFSIQNGGLVCSKCRDGYTYSGEFVEVLKILYLGKINILNDDLLNELPDYYSLINDLLSKYYYHYYSIRI